MRRVFLNAVLGFAVVLVSGFLPPSQTVRAASANATASLDEALRSRAQQKVDPEAREQQRARKLPAADEVRAPVIDPYDRIAQLWYRQRVAKSGVGRGQEIYYMSCWVCHNEYTIAADKAHAPSLKDLFKPEGVTDEIVTAKIRGGGSRMPAYPASVLTDQDIKDLLAYMRAKCGTFPTGPKGGGGCYDENNPPANPLYRGQ